MFSLYFLVIQHFSLYILTNNVLTVTVVPSPAAQTAVRTVPIRGTPRSTPILTVPAVLTVSATDASQAGCKMMNLANQ